MQAELVISLLPAFCHVTVANACIEVLHVASLLYFLCFSFFTFSAFLPLAKEKGFVSSFSLKSILSLLAMLMNPCQNWMRRQRVLVLRFLVRWAWTLG